MDYKLTFSGTYIHVKAILYALQAMIEMIFTKTLTIYNSPEPIRAIFPKMKLLRSSRILSLNLIDSTFPRNAATNLRFSRPFHLVMWSTSVSRSQFFLSLRFFLSFAFGSDFQFVVAVFFNKTIILSYELLILETLKSSLLLLLFYSGLLTLIYAPCWFFIIASPRRIIVK